MKRRTAVVLLACATTAGWLGAARAERLPRLSVERVSAQPSLAGELPTGLAWHPDGRRLTYVRRSGEATSLYAFDVGRGQQALLLDGSKLLIPGGDKPRPLRLGRGWSWLPHGRTLLVPAGGDIFTVDVASGAVRPLVRTPEAEEYPEASPDGKRVAFLRGNDLFVVDVASGREARLTHGGSDTLLNGRLDWAYEEELASRAGQAFAWSPDSRAIAYLQLDQSREPRFPIVDFVPATNDVAWQRYPTPATANAAVRLGVVGLDRDGNPGPERLLPGTDDDYLLPQLAWTQDSRALAFERLNRAQDELELRLLAVPASPRDPLGTPRTVLSERSKTWVNTYLAPWFLRDGHRFVWISERDGFAHLYLCDLGGGCRAITQGPWVVDALVSFAGASPGVTIDERSGFVYFTANEKDPRERHLYRVRLDGTGRARLTREDGTHRTLVSPDGRFYADTWSDAATPPKLWISSQDGTRRFTVEENAKPPILGFERGSTEFLELKAADGTTLYASLLKPADFDARKKYPVVVKVYGGPHVQTVTNGWSRSSAFDQLLASRGFLVWSLDNRGSAGRGAAFERVIFRDLGRVELEDQLAGVAYLRSLPYVDPARIGITGWSYGGYMTLYAVTHAPDAFRSAVAGAPVTDWRNYDSIYTERYMGTPATNPKGYEASSTLPAAGRLKADLLIVHGTADDNVHLANSVQFVGALVKAGGSAAVDLHPGQKHGFSAKEDQLARDRAILAHFERTLTP